MKANERISDVIGALQVEDQPCCHVQHRLESAQEVGWDADQHAVAVVQPGVHQSNDQHLKRGRWHAPTDLAELMQSSKTARYRSLNMYPHRHDYAHNKYKFVTFMITIANFPNVK